ncbi:hypothetical protein G6011_03335 [Alternaria panax]|uniref:Uncharacterized protein n=1 Tax=Alternaria panax TaxID=48097 RepID=A0AAD4NTX7_9PLEO|nr:hypothetical protein G6011_03335 [Alternaria panax]
MDWSVVPPGALTTLSSIPTADAEAILKRALFMGCDGGFTLGRAEVYQYDELTHHFFGCPGDKQCDLDESTTPEKWERALLVDNDCVSHWAPKLVVENMFKWTRLANIVTHYEELIRVRWLKKTNKQRKDILLSAWPQMATSHRADMEMVLQQCCPNQRSGGFGPFMLPYINLEDLTEPKSLLILLNARARHLPNEFAYSDFELAPLAQIRPLLLEPTDLTINFVGSYGNLIHWEDEDAARDSIAKGLTVHPVHGCNILQMQSALLVFLHKCCTKILHDVISSNAIMAGSITIAPEPPPPSDNNEQYSSLDVAMREAPYRLPARFSLVLLHNLVLACKEAAEDHIWSFREDPSYFAEVVHEQYKHRQELLLGEDCGRAHKNAEQRPLRGKVLRTMITDAYTEFYVWHEIQRRISQLHEMFVKYHCQTRNPQEELPMDFFEALVETSFFLEATMLDFVHQIEHQWCTSPAIRDSWTQSCDVGCENHAHPVQVKDSLRVDAFERLLQNSPGAKALVSPRVASYISQLSVASQCFQQLQLFQPWARRVKHSAKQRQTQLFIAYAASFSKWHDVLMTQFNGTNLWELDKPDAKFHYPADRRRSRANVESLRSAEAALNTFWDAADNRFRQKAGKTPHDIVSGIIQERALQRTPLYVERDHTLKQKNPSEAVEHIYVPIPNCLHEPTKQITGAFDKLSIGSTSKTKTHRLAGCSDGIVGPGYTDNQEPDRQPCFRLDNRACRVFRNLFHSPESRDQVGEIPWTDFLHAMVSTGFAAQKLQGSAWQFTPKDLDVTCPIQLHEPHPTHKLPFTWARRFGRRLARTYGWRGDMFQLA